MPMVSAEGDARVYSGFGSARVYIFVRVLSAGPSRVDDFDDVKWIDISGQR